MIIKPEPEGDMVINKDAIILYDFMSMVEDDDISEGEYDIFYDAFEMYGRMLREYMGMVPIYSVDEELAIDRRFYNVQDHVPILIGEESSPAEYGALMMKYDNSLESWVLSWVCLDAVYQRQGIFTSLWPRLIKEYGQFMVVPPYSVGMEKFLTKMRGY